MPRYDLKKAKALMAEAGFAGGFECTMIAPNNRYVNDEKIAEAVVGMLAKINIKVCGNSAIDSPIRCICRHFSIASLEMVTRSTTPKGWSFRLGFSAETEPGVVTRWRGAIFRLSTIM